MRPFLTVPLAVVLAGFLGSAGSGQAFARLAGNPANRLGYSHFAGPARSPLRPKLMNVKILRSRYSCC